MENYVGKICPFCKTEIKEEDAVMVCPACGIAHHAECWNENKGCTTFGCSQQHNEAQQTSPSNLCSNCGAPLGDGQAFCPACGTAKAAAPQKSFCSKCGTELQDGQTFCPQCGQKAGLVADTTATAAIDQFNANVTAQKQKKNIKIPVIIGAVLAVVIALFLIFKGPSVDKIELSESSVSLKIGDYINVSYTITPDDASEVEVKWESSDKSVATVNSNGKIEAKGEGRCTIKATAGGKSDTVQVEVTKMSKEEKLLLGTWNTVAMMDGNGDVSALPSYAGTFYAYDDFTGKITASETTLNFTWEYSKYKDGSYFYVLTLKDGGTIQCVLTELDGENSVAVKLSSTAIVVYQK